MNKILSYIVCLLISYSTIGFVSTASAQIIQHHPTTAVESSDKECSNCVVTSVIDRDNSLSADTTTYTEIIARRNSGIVGQGWAEVAYDLAKSPDNNNVYIRLTPSNNTAEPAVRLGSANNSEGGTTINLRYQGTQVNEESIQFEEFRDIHNNSWYRLTTESQFDQVVIRVTSKNYDFDREMHVRSAKIYALYTTEGQATLDDCGIPTMISFDSKLNGVPLAGPATSKLWQAIDNNMDTTSYASAVLAGVANIGDPNWNYTALFDGLSGGTSTLKLVLGRGATIVNLSGIRYKVHFIRNGVEFHSSDWTTLQVIGLLGINSYKPMNFYHEAPGPFDGIRIQVSVPGISLVGEMMRIYDIRRTVPAPTLSGASNSTLDVLENTQAQILATGAATEYLWYQGVKYTDPDTELTGYVIDENRGLIGKTEGIATGANLRTITQFSYGPVVSDSVLFVRSIRASCPTDTSAAHAINLRMIANPLPVTLIDFTVVKEETTALLAWNTTEETDNDYFVVQRSHNAKDWETIGQVASKAVNGTSAGLLAYSFIDERPLQGVNYYRLNQLDYSGESETSPFVSIAFDEVDAQDPYVYPNPASEYFQVAAAKGSQVKVFDMFGRVVLSGTVASAAYDITFDINYLPVGTYFVHITQNGILHKRLLQVTK